VKNMNFEYSLVKNIVSDDVIHQMKTRIWNRFTENKFLYDRQCPNSPSIDEELGDFEKLITPKVEEVVNQPCVFEFDYSRIYVVKGEVLVPHLDKKNCDIVVSIALDYLGHEPWPLHLYSENEKKIIEFNLERSDAAIYKGNKLIHWRNPFTGILQIQSFFLYSTNKKL
jgi:hypothetical protein